MTAFAISRERISIGSNSPEGKKRPQSDMLQNTKYYRKPDHLHLSDEITSLEHIRTQHQNRERKKMRRRTRPE